MYPYESVISPSSVESESHGKVFTLSQYSCAKMALL